MALVAAVASVVAAPAEVGNKQSGAGRESRTLVSSLGRIHNSRYTIPATPLLYHSITPRSA